MSSVPSLIQLPLFVLQKRCPRCGMTKDIFMFPRRGPSTPRPYAYCYDCKRDRERTYDATHREEQTAHFREWLDQHPEQKQRMSERDKRKRQARRQAGLCLQCAVPISGPYVRCAICRKASYDSSQRNRRQRTAKGLCGQCGAPALPGYLARPWKLCERCCLRRIAGDRVGNPEMWEELRALLIAQDHRCPYSGEVLMLGVNAHLDHRFPICRFPEWRNDLANVQWVSETMNKAKATLTHEEFVARLQGRGDSPDLHHAG